MAPDAGESAPILRREDSAPEIMLIGVEEVDLDPSPIRVVPAASANSELLEAVEDLMRPLRSRPPPPANAAVCCRCGQQVETPYCPWCGRACSVPDDD